MAKQAVVLEDISKAFRIASKDLQVLSKLSFSVAESSFVSVIGRNGCGKTTLLKIIAGIENQSSGNVRSPANAAYLPQQDSLLPWLNVVDNLKLPAKINSRARDISDQAIFRYLKQFKLQRFKNFYPAELSGGMRQKVSLLRAVIYQPDLIILDEPFSALDSITRMEIQRWFADLIKSSKATVICVTHDIGEAVFLSDEIVVLSDRPAVILKTFRVKDFKNNQLSLEKKLQKVLLSEKN